MVQFLQETIGVQELFLHSGNSAYLITLFFMPDQSGQYDFKKRLASVKSSNQGKDQFMLPWRIIVKRF